MISEQPFYGAAPLELYVSEINIIVVMTYLRAYFGTP